MCIKLFLRNELLCSVYVILYSLCHRQLQVNFKGYHAGHCLGRSSIYSIIGIQKAK